MVKRITFEEELVQLLKGLAITAGVLWAATAWFGREAPNLALNPAKLSPSTPFTQLFTLT